MKLHEDKTAFKTLINNIIERYPTLRADIIEKDYYVCLILEELSKKANQSYAYFKGGTALYLSLKEMRRFSEDIDLTIDISGCKNNSQTKKRLKDAVTGFSSLLGKNTIQESKGSMTVNYHYESLFDFDIDPLQRFGIVKVEGTSFTISEPIKNAKIFPQIYSLATEQEKEKLTSLYNVKPFEVITMTIERIFIDKIFACEYYYQRNKLYDAAKHIYDIVVLMSESSIKRLLNTDEEMKRLITIERKEELNRIGGIEPTLK